MLPLASRVTPAHRRRFLVAADDQALSEGRRYASLGRVEEPVEQEEGLTILVRGESGTYPVTFWIEARQLAAACECPSWRDPCKHQVAAALTLWPEDAAGRTAGDAPREAAAREAAAPGRAAARDERRLAERPDPEVARRAAIDERREAARREPMQVHAAPEPGVLLVASRSGFTYRVRLRGGADGPHSCDCPDFEANRLHCCKHVERARLALASGHLERPPEHVAAAERPRAYLHLGEVVEPRWFGPRDLLLRREELRASFDPVGRWLGPVGDEAAIEAALSSLGELAEPEALSWLQERRSRVPDYGGRDPAALVPPTPMPLHPYQRAGVAFLARSGRALLADEMGLGKTVQAILAAATMRHASPPVRSVTIACPASLRGGWQDEIRRWLGEEAVLVEGTQARRERTIASRPAWLVTHYEQVLRDRAVHHAHPPDLLIIDEAQRAKGLQAVTARALKDIRPRHVFALTGTPLENRLEEAYAIAQLIDQRLLPPLWQLERDHVVREERGRVVAYRGLDALRTRLAPAFLRRRKEDVALELPPRVRSLLLVPMHPAAEEPYETCLAQARRLAARRRLTAADRQRIQRLLTVCRRACDGPHLVGDERFDRTRIPKLAELEHVLRDVALGERRKVVVFSEWTDMTASVQEVARALSLPVFSLEGSVAVAARPQLIRAFNAQDGPAVFVSTDAGGLGLNLQAADVVVNLDLPWNPARLDQRLARVHRIGARRTVQEILVVTAGTIEHRMLALHESKRAVLENVWAEDGADVVLAPGAAELQHAALAELLSDEAPATAAPDSRHRPGAPEGIAPAAASAALDTSGLAVSIAEAARGLPPEQRAAVAEVLRSLADALSPR